MLAIKLIPSVVPFVKIISFAFLALINDLIVGDYKLWIYKDYNIIDNNYFSGTLEPLLLSSPFTVFDKIITIRSNWTNSISIDFKE